MAVQFEDNSIEVTAALNDAIIAALHEASGELEAALKRSTPVDTGELKNSWNYVVDDEKGVSTIGSPLQNSIWNEFGTGIHAVNGDGRQTPWSYKDAKGKWHYTRGKEPNHTFQNAFNAKKTAIIKTIERAIEEGMD